MVVFLTVIHVFLAVLLILLTFVQDSRSESLGGAFGGASHQSLFGPVGATTLFHKLTWGLFAAFVISSLGLAGLASRSQKSLFETLPPQEIFSQPAEPAASSPSQNPQENPKSSAESETTPPASSP